VLSILLSCCITFYAGQNCCCPLAQLADQQSRLKISLITAARDVSAALPNASTKSTNDDTDDDYFAFADANDTETSQLAADTTNKTSKYYKSLFHRTMVDKK